MNSVAVNNQRYWLNQEIYIDVDEENEALSKNYPQLISLIRKANLIKDYKLSTEKVLKNSVKGEELVHWIMKETKVKQADAIEIGQGLLDKHFVLQTSKEHGPKFNVDSYYQLVEEDHTIPLNNGAEHRPNTVKIHHFNETLREVEQEIFDKILSEDKRLVYLDRLDDNKDFKKYLKLIKHAANLDLRSTTTEERLALFLNIINMMVVHIIYKFGIPATVWHKKKYIFSTYYMIGGHLYSPQSIFNGILRGNRKGLWMLWEPFGNEDRRLPVVIHWSILLPTIILHQPHQLELILFKYGRLAKPRQDAILDPFIGYYHDLVHQNAEKNVKNEMRENARKALHADYFLRIDSTKKNIIYLNRIFQSYMIDFGQDNDEIMSWILNVLDEGNLKEKLQSIYDSGQYSIAFLDNNSKGNHIKERKICNDKKLQMNF